MWRTICAILGTVGTGLVAVGMFLPASVTYRVDDSSGNALLSQLGLPENAKPGSLRAVSIVEEMFGLLGNWAILGVLVLVSFTVASPILLSLKLYDPFCKGLGALTIVNVLVLLGTFAGNSNSAEAIREGYRHKVVWDTLMIIGIATGLAFLAARLGEKHSTTPPASSTASLKPAG